jgi:hypothetical protein
MVNGACTPVSSAVLISAQQEFGSRIAVYLTLIEGADTA